MKANAQKKPLGQKQHRCRIFGMLLMVFFAFIPLCHSAGTIGVPFVMRIDLNNGQPRLQWFSALGQSYDVEACNHVPPPLFIINGLPPGFQSQLAAV